MASSSSSSSSSRSRRYDVFPSFSGEDVRKSFLSHLLKELDRKSINTFIDHGIERSSPIGPELLSAIRESRISIVVLSKNYASSTWCLNELVEILKCYKDLKQMVIPVFYKVDPSEVRKQTGEFKKVFEETCKGKTEDQIRRWTEALADVANMAGEDLRNWPNEADMIGKIADDVSKKLITRKANSFGDFVGIEDHLEAVSSMLCLESEEARMIGIVGPSGIGKSTIARALFSQLSSQFHFSAFLAYKRTNHDDYGMKLIWEQQFLSEILGEKDLKIYQLGEVERRLKHKKVLIVLDDVDNIALLETLVGETRWFGSGSRIIVITQDWQLLKAHEIDLVYEVKFPSEHLALKMLCRSAFRRDSPPDGFMNFLVEVTWLAGNLPLGLNVLGSSLRGRNKEEWMEMIPRLRNNLDGKIEKTLRVGYDGLDGEGKDIFLYIACLFNGKQVDEIKNLLGDSVDNIGFKLLAEKSLIRITSPDGMVEMHSLLQKVGREIAREEYKYNPGKRRFLVDAKDIIKVLTNHTGTETVLGINFNTSDIKGPLFLDEKSFEGMPNLQFLRVCVDHWFPEAEDRLNLQGHWFTDHWLPQGLLYLPPGLRLLSWEKYPSKCLPFTFKAEFLVEIDMMHSKLEKLWDGTQPLRSLKKMNLSCSRDLKEIPDLSNATNLDVLYLQECKSLVSLHPSIQNLINLSYLSLQGCESLVSLHPSIQNLINLSCLYLNGCISLASLHPSIQNLINLSILDIEGCVSLVTLPPSIQNLTKLESLSVARCRKLEFIPILPDNMEYLGCLDFTGCPRLINFPQIRLTNNMEGGVFVDVDDSLWINNRSEFDCLGPLLRCLPGRFGPKDLTELRVTSKTLRKLWEGPQPFGSLKELKLSGCENLIEFPDLSKTTNLEKLELNDCKSLVTVPSTIGYLNKLVKLEMIGCIMLEALPNDINLSSLETLDLSGCSSLRTFPQISRSIKTLCLRDTAIEQVPCSIENFSSLSVLIMRGCERLQTVSRNIFKRLVKMDFSDCGEVTAMSDAIVVATVSMEDQFPPRSSYGGSIRESIYCNFNNCFKLDEHARELILRSYYSATVLPGGEVPTYFTHQASGYSLTVTVPQSSLSQEFLRFKTCLVVDHGTDLFLEVFPYVLGVRWYFRGRSGMHNVSLYPRKMDHLVMFHFGLTLGELSGPPSDVGYNHVKFEFFHHTYDCCHFAEPCPLSLQRVKRCGVRVLNVSPSACGATTSSESEYNQQSEENCDVETGRSKKRMRMAVRESEESSNTLCGRIVENTGGIVPNLELSLGQGEASTQVSSRRNKIPSSSVSSSNNFHCEGASLCLSLSPSYPCLKGEASCVVDPMITEQQDTETTIVVHSLSPQFINNLSLSPSEPCLGGEAIFFDPMITEQQDTETSSIVDGSLSPHLINFLR